MIDVSIILVNYKTPILTKHAIESIISKSENFTYEIIVVDNSDSDSDFDELSNQLDGFDVKLLRAESNLGFGKGNNLGAEHSNGKYLYFINTDTRLINNAIFELFIYLQSNKDVGVAGSNLFDLSLKPNHSFVREEKNLKYEKKINSLFSFIFKSKKRKDFNYGNSPLSILGYVCGASLMVSKALFNIIGGFDKDIFMYSEESLFCYIARKKHNRKIVNVPSSKIIHFEGGSQADNSIELIERMARGTMVYYKKAFGTTESKKYLSICYRASRLKSFLFSFFYKKQKAEYYKKRATVYKKLIVDSDCE